MKHLLLFSLLLAGTIVFAQKGIVNNGARIVVDNGAYIKIQGDNTTGFQNKSDGANHGQVDLNGEIHVDGFFKNDADAGTVFVNQDGVGKIVFTGSTSQTLGGTLPIDAEGIEVAGGGDVTLSNDVSVAGDVTFTSGLLVLNNNNLTFGASSGVAGTPGTGSMIVPDDIGFVQKEMTGTGSFTFPIGDNTSTDEYSPVTANVTSGSFGGSAYIEASVTNAKHPENINPDDYLDRYWTLNSSDITGLSAILTMTYKDADIVGTEDNLFTMQYNSGVWASLDAANTGANTLSATVTNLGDFTGAGVGYTITPSVSGNWGTVVGVTNSMSSVIIPNGIVVTIPSTKEVQECNDLNVEPGGMLTVVGQLDVYNNLTVESDATGNGSLINTGTINVSNQTAVQQYLATNSQPYNWHYLGVPITTETADVFPGVAYSGTTYAATWDESSDDYVLITDPGATLSPMVGYAVPSSVANTVEFSGADLNSGTQSVLGLGYTPTSSKAGFHLVSNPFTAAVNLLDAGFSLSNWTEDVWYRHDGQFATYNVNTHASTNGGSQYVPSMQAFWIRNDDAGNSDLYIDPAALSHQALAIYKQPEKTFVSFEVSKDGFTDEAVVGFFEGAENGFDKFDTEKYFGTNQNYPEIYTISGEENVAVNAFAPFNNNIYSIPMGFEAHIGGDFFIQATNLPDFDEKIDVYLEDTYENEIVNLRDVPGYSFYSDAVNTTNRFKIIMSPATGTNIDGSGNAFTIVSGNQQLLINSSVETKGNIYIFDVSGKQVLLEKLVLNIGLNKVDFDQPDGMYLVTLVSKIGTFTEKVVIK